MTDADDEYYDLDKVADERRSKRVPFKFLFRGQKRQLANLYSCVDLDTLEAAQNSDLAALRLALTLGLGPAAAADINVGTLTLDDLVPLFEQWSARSGSTPGESPASTSSSGSTGRPSKRTSSASTGSSSAKLSTVPRKPAVRRVSSSSGSGT